MEYLRFPQTEEAGRYRDALAEPQPQSGWRGIGDEAGRDGGIHPHTGPGDAETGNTHARSLGLGAAGFPESRTARTGSAVLYGSGTPGCSAAARTRTGTSAGRASGPDAAAAADVPDASLYPGSLADAADAARTHLDALRRADAAPAPGADPADLAGVRAHHVYTAVRRAV